MPGRTHRAIGETRTRADRARRTPRAFAGRAGALLLVVGLLTAVSSFGSTPARAAGPRTLTVTPATGLGNQAALVQWSGFDPTVGFTDTVTILQCTLDPTAVDIDHNPNTVDDCLTATPFPNAGNEVTSGFTQSDGTGSAYIEILPAAQNPALNCSETKPCTLVAYENNGTPPPVDSLPTTAATTTLDFAKSIDDCPPVTKFDLRAEGEASAAQLIYNWAANLCTADPKLILDYTETSSVSGRKDFLNKLVDIGVTSMPPTSAELAASPNHPQYTYAPIDLTADVVAYNMDNPTTGKQITNLVLSPRLLARVISDTNLTGPKTDPDSFWADPELNQLNPGETWPDQALSQPLIRAEDNADTYIVTDWIAHNADAEKFLQGDDPDGVTVTDGYKDVQYPTDIFENLNPGDNAYLPIQSETPVIRKLFYGVKPAETTPTDPRHTGFIGVVDLPTALRYRVPIANLVNASGNAAGVAPDAASIAAGYKAMTVNPDGITKFPNFANTDPTAYPMVKVDYAMIPTQVATATEQTNLKNLLAYIAGPGQSALPVGYSPMPDDLRAQDLAAAAKITVAKPTTSPTTKPTTPTTTAITSPSDVGSLGSSFASDSSSSGSSDTTSPATTTAAPGTKPSSTKPAKRAKKLAHATPVVEIANAGERFGLPVIVLLALLAGLYPLTRRSRPYIQRGISSLRARVHLPRRGSPPKVDANPIGSA